MIPRTQLQMMAENFARRAEQHDKLGDTEGALKYQRLARDCARQLGDHSSDLRNMVHKPPVSGDVLAL